MWTCKDRQDQPWVFDKQSTYEVHGHVTHAAEVLGVECVAQSGDVGQSGQLVSSEEWRTTTQTVIPHDTHRDIHT